MKPHSEEAWAVKCGQVDPYFFMVDEVGLPKLFHCKKNAANWSSGFNRKLNFRVVRVRITEIKPKRRAKK